MKILWITNMPTIYRVHFFNELGKFCDLHVYFERYSATGVKNKWDDTFANNFKAYFVHGKPIGREGSFTLDLLKINFEEYDRIIVSSYSSPSEMIALIKLKACRIDYFLEVDGGVIKSESKVKKSLKHFLISGATGYFSTSQKTDDYLIYYGANSNRIYRYHFSSIFDVDILNKVPTLEEKQQLRTKLNLHCDHIVLGVGQFIYRKGFDILIKAAKQLVADTKVVIIGGNVPQEYTDIIKENDIKNVSFISEISKENLELYYKAADVFVLPTREDIWGLVINEAMAKGLPVITTDNCVAGIELIENDENGYIVHVDDLDSIVSRVNYLLTNPVFRDEVSQKNLEKIKKYSIEEMAKEHYKILLNQ